MRGIHSTGDMDKDFALMMRMHHQMAVDMAEDEIAHGKSTELQAMARKTMQDQQAEIERLDAWLKAHP